jgi:pilus assembly protein Flp/PilA
MRATRWTARLFAAGVRGWDAVRRNRGGQALVEYALILALVAIVVIAALHFLGGAASNTLNNVTNAVTNG